MKNITEITIGCLVGAIILIITIGLLEGVIFSFIWFPSWNNALPESLRSYPIQIYTYLDRELTRGVAVWDRELTYTLRPNVDVQHKNREFNVRIKTNRLGVRDDDESLVKPDIIVIGDSFAMGFGVDQGESFPEIIERELGMKVLNTGIESYGTAREITMLNRVDTSNIKYLIVQYCNNDFDENVAFIKNYGLLKTMGRAEFDSTLNNYLDSRRYYFGKYLWYFLNNIRNSSQPYISREEISMQSRMHAKIFLETLSKTRISLDNVQVIAFDMVDEHTSYVLQNDIEYDSELFIKNLMKLAKQDNYPEFIKRMKVFSYKWHLGRDERFILDGHINPAGHIKIAKELIRLMN